MLNLTYVEQALMQKSVVAASYCATHFLQRN